MKTLLSAIVLLSFLFVACEKETPQIEDDNGSNEIVFEVYQPIDTVAWLGEEIYTYIGSDNSITIQSVPIGQQPPYVILPLFCGKIGTNSLEYQLDVPVHKIWIDTLEVCDGEPIIQIAYR